MTSRSFHQIGVITLLTFREAQRRRLLWIGLGLGIAFIALFAVGYYFAWKDYTENVTGIAAAPMFGIQFANGFMMAGLYVVNFLVVMVTVLTSVGTISAEIQTSTIHTIASKPLQRWEIVVGKWLGHAFMITLYTFILSTGVILSVYFISGYSPSNVVSGILVMVLEGLAILSVTLLGSSIFPTLANGVVVFMLYGLAFVGGWVEQIGTIMGSQTATDLGILSSLLMPSEALWRYAAGLMQPTQSLGASVTPFSVISQPTDAFAIYSVIYTLISLLGTILVFRKRDF